MALFRARMSAFLAGFAVASAGALVLLQRDLWASHRVLTEQAEGYKITIEERLERLEKLAGSLTSDIGKSFVAAAGIESKDAEGSS